MVIQFYFFGSNRSPRSGNLGSVSIPLHVNFMPHSFENDVNFGLHHFLHNAFLELLHGNDKLNPVNVLKDSYLSFLNYCQATGTGTGMEIESTPVPGDDSIISQATI